MLLFDMRVIAKRTLIQFWQRHNQAEQPLRAWYGIADKSVWKTPQDVRDTFGNSVDFVADNRVIFDIGGNKYRLIVRVSYEHQRVLIKFVGTHQQYDRIDPETV